MNLPKQLIFGRTVSFSNTFFENSRLVLRIAFVQGLEFSALDDALSQVRANRISAMTRSIAAGAGQSGTLL